MSYPINVLWASGDTYTAGNSGREWIVVHYTATAASAHNNAIYFSGGYRGASAHFFVDDDSIWQSVPEGDSAWHAGNWAMNSSSIGIEVVSDGSDFTEGEIARLSWLVQMLMNKYDIDADHVIRHYDVADHCWGPIVDPHKLCPRPYVDNAKWRELHARITAGSTEEEDKLLPEEIDEIVRRTSDETARKVIWGHQEFDGNKHWTIGGALFNLVKAYNSGEAARKVWDVNLAGTKAGDRQVGTDKAANGAFGIVVEIRDLIKRLGK